MSVFCLKKIKKPIKVGTILHQKRKGHNLALTDIEQITKIPKEYLIAIEKNNIEQLPQAKILQISYIKKYAEVLKINGNKLSRQFCYENNLDNYTVSHPNCQLKIRRLSSLIFWFKRAGIAMMAIVFLGYLTWQINGILKPPKLVIYTPSEGYLAKNLKTLIQGETDKEVSLQINGKDVNINERGAFETPIDLSKGVNTITITATKKHGKQTSLTRHVIVKESIANQNKVSLNN